jgi:hypothetical protein
MRGSDHDPPEPAHSSSELETTPRTPNRSLIAYCLLIAHGPHTNRAPPRSIDCIHTHRDVAIRHANRGLQAALCWHPTWERFVEVSATAQEERRGLER